MLMGYDLGDRFFSVMNQAFATLHARGVADLPAFPLVGCDKGEDRRAVYCDRLMRHSEHIASRSDEIAVLLEQMLAMHDRLADLEDDFDRLAGLISSEDPGTSDRAIRDYNDALDRKSATRMSLRGVLSEAIVIKFASISYTLFPIVGRGRVRAEISLPMQALRREKALLGSNFSPEKQGFLEHLDQQSKDESKGWQSLRSRRGEDLAALFEPLMTDVLPYLDRDARDQIVHFDERIDTNEARSPQMSFADLPAAELAALRQRMAQLCADGKAVSAGIWRFRNRLTPE